MNTIKVRFTDIRRWAASQLTGLAMTIYGDTESLDDYIMPGIECEDTDNPWKLVKRYPLDDHMFYTGQTEQIKNGDINEH